MTREEKARAFAEVYMEMTVRRMFLVGADSGSDNDLKLQLCEKWFAERGEPLRLGLIAEGYAHIFKELGVPV